jgi:adenylate kinase family enzyme
VARAVAEHYGLVYVPGNEISDLKSRLLQDDCSRIGWVLWGYAMSASQVQLLQKINAAPTRVVAIDGAANEELKQSIRVLELSDDAEILKRIQIYIDHPL